ncbi:putative transcriptional regulator, TetR family protein [Actinoplanes sp. NBRC 14428]|uniref:TetR family transcriptional regulator n=1 Tax=Pseudosporangium ferrugineum TaxID=439699 RepID=A0A2T0SCX4_9ACTN|nr:TetR/AcrR family transcriptional regulator [Pseudosporangium ferrugineum]PRY31267.1 TetR family transcriptional regulator [Pseudosporangium ferrugineum]BCJ54597.1 putative transcriptional regulator, TetR family protein [Actinoplanes sp. NBRC 14428]
MSERLTRAQQQERTRRRLLDSAETLFADRGIHRTTLDEIAAAAGLTKGAIYANFGGKDDLIAALLQRRLDDGEPVRQRMTPESWVATMGESYEAHAPTPEVRRFAMAVVELWLFGMRDGTKTELLRGWMRSVRAHIAEDAAAVGERLPLPAEQVAALLLALDVGVALQYLTDPEAVPVSTYTRGVEALLGLPVRPPGR